MAAADKELAPIIVKRVKKGGHGHHGGSWKVAFADFATAMMAFFLLLWLMGTTTPEQKGAISEYFKNPAAIPGANTVAPPSPIHGPGGVSTNMIELSKTPEPPLTQRTETGEDVEQADRARLESLLETLQRAIEERESLARFKDQILLDITPEGVRIQIIDHERRPMFPLGSARLETFTAEILREIAGIIATVPNAISISGHTDIRPYVAPNYSNWELSADRANAARRALLAGGLSSERIGRVVGLASTVLLDPLAPENPVNRRISIVVMNKRTEAAIRQENGTLLSVQDAESAAATPAEAMAHLIP